MPSPSVLQRLKERKLVQWAVAYQRGALLGFRCVEVAAVRWGRSLGAVSHTSFPRGRVGRSRLCWTDP
jgi:hypothetical protein